MADDSTAHHSGCDPQISATIVTTERSSGGEVRSHEKDDAKKRKSSMKKPSSPRSGKSVARKCENVMAAKPSASVSATRIESFEDKILSAISAINAKMDKQDQRMQVVASRLDAYDEFWTQDEGHDDDDVMGDQGMMRDASNPSPHHFEGFVTRESSQESDNGDQAHRPVVPVVKRNIRCVDQDDTVSSVFKKLGKKFISTEVCDSNINQDLADNVNYLFKNGIEEERYKVLIKDEENPRPANCEALTVVKVNQLVWEAVTPAGRTRDLKMQNMEASIIKAATILAKSVDVMGNAANADGVLDGDVLGKLVEDNNDVLALLGHTNKQINMARKDFLRKEINPEYSHLCNHNIPVTKFLFGDDVSQSAKDIEDCSKLSNKMFQTRPMRGWPRQRLGRMSRFRASSPYSRGRGRAQSFGGYGSPGPSTSGTNGEPKNAQRRGSRPYRY